MIKVENRRRFITIKIAIPTLRESLLKRTVLPKIGAVTRLSKR
jgi:hypothetical protein